MVGHQAGMVCVCVCVCVQKLYESFAPAVAVVPIKSLASIQVDVKKRLIVIRHWKGVFFLPLCHGEYEWGGGGERFFTTPVAFP
jgi:hypothetical protein